MSDESPAAGESPGVNSIRRAAQRRRLVLRGMADRPRRAVSKPEAIVPVPPGAREAPRPRDLINDAPVCCHFAQLQPAPEKLAERVGEFVISGIKRAERVLIIAPPDHVKTVLDTLQRLHCDPTALQWSGHLAVLDAQWTLAQIMRSGQPAWIAFRRVIETAFNRGPVGRAQRMRAYSELVSLLWGQGLFAAALDLERHWDRLVQEHGFPLFCGHLLDRWNPSAYEGPLEDIGRLHETVLPSDEDERFQEAVDAAGAELLGEDFFTISRAAPALQKGGGLPHGYDRILTLKRLRPESCGFVLDRARQIHATSGDPRWGFAAHPLGPEAARDAAGERGRDPQPFLSYPPSQNNSPEPP